MQDSGSVERSGGVAANETEYHRLARNAHEQRQAKHLQFVHLSHQAIVVVECLAKTESGVENDVLHSQVAQLLYLLCESHEHLLDIGFHRHQYVGHSKSRHHAEHVRIVALGPSQGLVDNTRYAAFRHIVHYSHTIFLHRHACHVGAEGVNRYNGVGLLATQDLQSIAQAFHLLGLAHLGSARTGGECAHVDYLAALVDYLVAAFGNLLLGLLATSREVGVVRNIQYAHHFGATHIHEFASHINCIFQILYLQFSAKIIYFAHKNK